MKRDKNKTREESSDKPREMRQSLAELEKLEAERKRIEHALAASEVRYRRLFEAAQDGILILDAATGQIDDVNPFLTDMLGYSKQELLGKQLWEIGLFEDARSSRKAFRQLQKAGYVRYEDLPLQTKDGRRVEVEFVSNIYTVDGDKVIQCNIRDISDRKRGERVLATAKEGLEEVVRERTAELENVAASLRGEVDQRTRANDEMRDLARRLVGIQEEERRSLALELHDETGQSLTALKMMLGRAVKSRPDEAVPTLMEAIKLSENLIRQVRSLSLDLRPSILDDLGLLPALKWLFEQYTLKTKIQVDFRHKGLDHDLSPETRTAAYRIVQEALTNVARHAGMNWVMVQAHIRKGALELRIQDKGKGFDPERATGASTGLSGMRERCRMLGGEFKVKSSSGTGTTLACKLPVGLKNV